MYAGNGANDPLTIEVNCQTFMLVYKETSENAYGSADLYVDGVKKSTLHCHNSSGWNNGKVCIALQEKESAMHKIELKMAAGDEAKKFTLYAMGYQTDYVPVDQAVENVKTLIDAIGKVYYDDASKKKIDAAREAYDKLTDAQKALVNNYQVLTDAEANYKSLAPAIKISVAKAAVNNIEDQYYTGKPKTPVLTITYAGSNLNVRI